MIVRRRNRLRNCAPFIFGICCTFFLVLFLSKGDPFDIFWLLRREVQGQILDHSVILKPLSNFCSLLDFLVVVHTRHDDYQTRDFYRSTYGSSLFTRQYRYKILFPVGLNPNHRDRLKDLVKLKDESSWHGDILLGSYVDSYRNISIKQLSHLSYFSEHCPESTVLLKIDDDVAALSKDLKESQGHILCLVWNGMKVQRNPSSKWYVHPKDFNGTVYPDYCSGIAYLINNEGARRIVKASENVPFFWVDDVYITGFLASHSSVSRTNISPYYQLRYDNGSGLELGSTTFQMGPRSRRVEMFKKSVSGMKRLQKYPYGYYCLGPFCHF